MLHYYDFCSILHPLHSALLCHFTAFRQDAFSCIRLYAFYCIFVNSADDAFYGVFIQ